MPVLLSTASQLLSVCVPSGFHGWERPNIAGGLSCTAWALPCFWRLHMCASRLDCHTLRPRLTYSPEWYARQFSAGRRRTVSSVSFGASYKSDSKVERQHRCHSVNLSAWFSVPSTGLEPAYTHIFGPLLPHKLQGHIALTGYVAGLRLCLRAVAGREARRWERRRKWKGAGGIRPHAPIVA